MTTVRTTDAATDPATNLCIPVVHTGEDDLDLFVEGDTLYEAMLEAIRGAL